MAVKLPVSMFPAAADRAAKPIAFVIAVTLLLIAAGKKRREAQGQAK